MNSGWTTTCPKCHGPIRSYTRTNRDSPSPHPADVVAGNVVAWWRPEEAFITCYDGHDTPIEGFHYKQGTGYTFRLPGAVADRP